MPKAREAGSRPFKVIGVTPAGRRRYLSILVPCLLRSRHVLNEHHFWLNTTDPEDIAYIRELAKAHPDYFKVIEPYVPVDGIRSIHQFFRFAREPEALYVRLDDDICWLAHDALERLVDFRIEHPEPFLVYANIINNAICSHRHQQAGILPIKAGICGTDAFCPVGHGSKDFAESVHRSFFSLMQRDQLDRYEFEPMTLDSFERVSINACSWFGRDIREPDTQEEEQWLSVECARRTGRPNMICGTALVAHFAFWTQREHLEKTELLSGYRRLSEAVMSNRKIGVLPAAESTSPSMRTVSSPPRKNLIVVRAGNTSLHREWMAGSAEREFDLLISFYGRGADIFAFESEFYRRDEGLKVGPIHDLLGEEMDLIRKYEYVAFPDDDLRATAETWNQAFAIMAEYNLDVAQPSITGHVNWPYTAPHTNCTLRFVTFIELMTPVFSRRAIELVRDTFSENVSGWGIDRRWSQLLPYPQYRTAIIDAVSVEHTRPGGIGATYQILHELGIDPAAEAAALFQKFNLPQDCAELARVRSFIVNSPLREDAASETDSGSQGRRVRSPVRT